MYRYNTVYKKKEEFSQYTYKKVIEKTGHVHKDGFGREYQTLWHIRENMEKLTFKQADPQKIVLRFIFE